MSSLRYFLRTFVPQYVKCRPLSTENAVATFKAQTYAVRTSEEPCYRCFRQKQQDCETAVTCYNCKFGLLTEKTNQTNEDVGKLYTMPNDVRQKLFAKYVLPMYFERFCDTFNETNIIVRPPALELIDYLKRADYNRPIIRYVLYGKFGCGKTLTLIHALNYAINNEFLIVYIPSVWNWFHWSKEVVASEKDPAVLELPLEGGTWLKEFETANSELLKKLDLKLSRTYEWNPRERTAEGVPLEELVAHGINRVKYSCQVIDALLYELKLHARNNKCKVFMAIDGFNGFLQTSSRLKTAERVKLVPESNCALTTSFLSFIKNDWNNGAAVLVVDDHANVKGEYSSHFPFHLLRKKGVELIDPFIPINIPNYSPIEFQNYLDYLEEMRYLQKPEGRDEIEFITQRNPRTVNTYCATR